MKITPSSQATERPQNPDVIESFASVSTRYLRSVVEEISIPRHAIAEPINNKKVACWIKEELVSFGYDVGFQGRYENVVATLPLPRSGPMLLVGAHYDSVPGCPGADDNASAIAVMLSCAKAVAKIPNLNVCFVAFNCEEDGFLGSSDFVSLSGMDISGCHILEMVGFCSNDKGSQNLPPGLPIKMPETGDFLGLLGNHRSAHLVDSVLSAGKSYLPEFPVIGLKLYVGLERLLSDLNRSDHVPFWNKDIPATMWTDTANFRNPHYHRFTDRPETLNYGFMSRVTKLLIASIIDTN